MLTHFAKMQVLLLLALSSSAISAEINKKLQKNTFNTVIKAGSPLGEGGESEQSGTWDMQSLIAQSPILSAQQKTKIHRYALATLKHTPKITSPEQQKYLAHLAKKGAPTPKSATAPSVLVLYDYRPADAFGKLGKAYAIMLRNLLGHFNADVTLVPIGDYVQNSVNAYEATFYMGSYAGNTVNAAFLADAKITQQKVIWLKYNLEQLTAWGDQNGSFAQKFGFYFKGMQGLDSDPAACNPAPGFYNTVLYKNKRFIKYFAYDALSNTVFADYNIGKTIISNATIAQQIVPIQNAKTNAEIPYIIQSNNFWYIADTPFSFIGPRDRYLVFADILHDILDRKHPEQHRAMVRLEDLSAITNPATITLLSDYLYQQKIPFSMAVIPYYIDALGRFNGGVRRELALNKDTNLQLAINYAQTKGGAVIQHGYTHQYGNSPNPNMPVSGEDFEFWDLTDQDGDPTTYNPVNAAIKGETSVTVLAQIDAGKAELTQSGYLPFAWETPHYQASPVAYRAAALRYPVAYERAVYYTAEAPIIDPRNPTTDVAIGQFFPYIIEQDYYGRRVLPENIGNIQSSVCNTGFSCEAYNWQDLCLNAEYALAVRDGFASFFFHPFLLNQSSASAADHAVGFQNIIGCFNELHYQWVGANTLIK